MNTYEFDALIEMAEDGLLQPFIMKNKAYSGNRVKGGQPLVMVANDGQHFMPLDPEPSKALKLHSPDGFKWGGPGSSQAQLALAILLDCTDAKTALANHMDFMWEFVATWGNTWSISEKRIGEWLASPD